LPEIEMTCDRVLIINRGRVVAQGSPADLRREVLGRTTYQLITAGSLDALPTLLTAVEPTLKITATSEPDATGFVTLALSTERTDELGEPLLQSLITHGFRVRALSRAQPTLEDVFLAATRRSWDAKLAPVATPAGPAT
jgi:ABC-2 type transport system ATP-binding protein